MRAKRLVAAACILPVVAIVALAFAVRYLDVHPLVASVVASIKTETGRELTYDEVRVSMLPRPALELSEVRFGNAAWGSQPWLAQVGRVSADIDVVELFAGRLRVRHITVADASVLLETDRDGNGNWVMGRADAENLAWLKALAIDELTLESLAFTYLNGTTGKATSVQIDAARIAGGAASAPMHIEARAALDGRRMEASGTIGALAALIANASAFPVDIEGRFAGAEVSVHGTIDQPRSLVGFNLALRAQVPEFAGFIALFGATVPPLGPFRGATQLTGTPAAPVFSGIDIELGVPARQGFTARGEIVGSAAAGGGFDWRSKGVDLLLQGEQFGELGSLFGKMFPAWGAYRIAARIAGPATAPGLSGIDVTIGGRGTPGIKVDGAIADARKASGIDLTITAAATEWWQAVATDGPRLPPFRASARVRDARQGYRFDDLELKIADSIVNATLQVTQSGPRLHVSGKAASPLIDLARLSPATGTATASDAAPRSQRPADYWKLADVDLDLNIGRLVMPDGRQLQSGSGRLALDNGRLKATALQATLGGARVKLDGIVADPQHRAGLDLKLAVQGGELAELGKFFGTSVAAAGPYQGQAQLRGTLDTMSITGLDATAGRPGQTLHVSGRIEDARKWRGFQLALTAQVNDSIAAGRLLGVELPRLPALRASARFTDPEGGYVLDDLKFALGRTSMQGRVVFAPGEPRPRVTANLSGPLADLSELPSVQTRAGAPSPLLAADVEADLRFDRVVLPGRRALGAVSGGVQLAAGAVELKQFAVAVDGAYATLDGRINDPLALAKFELMVNARFNHGAGLAALTGLRLQSLPAFTASGKLTDVPDGYALAGLTFVTAATTIAGDLVVTRGARRFKVGMKATSPLLDIPGYVRAAGAKPVTAGARVIPDLPLRLDVLEVVDADLDLRFDTVRFGDAAPLGALLVRATIADGLLKAETLQLTVQAGRTLKASGTVDAAQAAWALRIDGVGIDLGTLVARFGRPGTVSGGVTEVTLQFQGRGKSLAAILGSLNGELRLKVGPYSVNNFTVDFNTPIFIRMFGLAGAAKNADPNTAVSCLAARVPIRNGVLTSERNVAIETTRYNAVMSGTLDLRTELINAAVTPIVAGGRGIADVDTIVQVRGTLAAPVVSVDAAAVVAKSAASVGATVATFGGWWLADTLIRKSAADPHPCLTALAQ